jgi:plastin-1
VLVLGSQWRGNDRAGAQDGFTALHRSCVTGNAAMVEHLLKVGANVNEKDAFGDSPLHYACFCGHIAVVKCLVEHGADPMRVSADGKTPVQSAQEEGHSEVVKFLQSSGATLTTPTVATSGPATAMPLASDTTSAKRLVHGLDFSVGVLLEGELKKKRANKIQKWRRKYYVMSATYGAVFFWTGDRDHVEGVIKKIRFETVFWVRNYPDKQAGKRFDIRVTTGRTMELLAETAELAKRWTNTMKEHLGRPMAALRVQTVWRGHVARKKLKHLVSERSKVVAGAEASALKAAADTTFNPILMEGVLKKKNSTISASLLSAFRTRYFVLDISKAALLYYKSKAQRNVGEAPAKIPIVTFMSAVVVRDRKGATTNRFLLNTISGRTFTFEAPSSKECELWVTALSRAMPRDNIAAIAIQKRVRGFLARKHVREMRLSAEEAAAAVISQYSAGRSPADVIVAAVRISSAIRGYLGRRKATQMRHSRRRAQAARQTRLYLKSRSQKHKAPSQRSKGQESRMQRMMRLKALREAKGKGGDADWTKHTDEESGRDFWHNAKTDKTTWHDPALPRFGLWVEVRDADGDVFYVNEDTQESQWEMPDEVRDAKSARRNAVWIAQRDPDGGGVFFANQHTSDTQWDKPEGFDEQFPPVGACFVWVCVTDEDGDTYYSNHQTGEVQWDKPDDFEDPEAAGKPKSAWRQILDADSGRKYWYNDETGESQWDPPKGMAGEGAPADPAEILAFTSWANETLSSHPGQVLVAGEGAAAAAVGWLAGRLPLSVEASPPALVESSRNGVLLAKLVNAVGSTLSGDLPIDERVLEVDAAPSDASESSSGDFFFGALAADPCLENAQLALSAAKSIGAMLPADVTAKHITNGNAQAICEVVWALWRRSLTATVTVRARPDAVCLLHSDAGEELADLMRLKPEELLLRWINYQLDMSDAWTSDRRCSAFGSELQDGKILSAVVRRLCEKPELQSYIPGDEAARNEMSVEDLAGNTIWVAAQLGAPEWFSVEAITAGNVRLQTAFVAMLWQKVDHSMRIEPSGAASAMKRHSTVRRHTLDTHGLAAAQKELAGMIKEETEGEDAKTITRETRSQRQWINSLSIPGVAIHDLAVDVRDGVTLLQVIDRIEPNLVNWRRAHLKPRNRYEKLENCNLVIKLAKAMELTIVNLSGMDLASGNPKLVAAVVWQLMRHHTLRILSQAAFSGFDVTDAQIIEWANEQVAEDGRGPEGGSASSFSDPSLKTSIFLLRLFNTIRPVVDWSLVEAGATAEEQKNNAQYLLSVARRLGAAVFCTWEDIVEVRPKMIMTLLASAIVLERQMQAGVASPPPAGDKVARRGSESEDEDADLVAAAAAASVSASSGTGAHVAEYGDSDESDDDEGAAASASARA